MFKKLFGQHDDAAQKSSMQVLQDNARSLRKNPKSKERQDAATQAFVDYFSGKPSDKVLAKAQKLLGATRSDTELQPVRHAMVDALDKSLVQVSSRYRTAHSIAEKSDFAQVLGQMVVQLVHSPEATTALRSALGELVRDNCVLPRATLQLATGLSKPTLKAVAQRYQENGPLYHLEALSQWSVALMPRILQAIERSEAGESRPRR